MSANLPDSKIAATISECCAWAVPITLLLCDDQIAGCGCFRSLAPSTLRLAIHALGRPDAPPPPDPRPGQRCTVTFIYRGRPHFFVVPVIGMRQSTDEPTVRVLELQLPEQIPAAEGRQTLRFPLSAPDAIAVEAIVFGKALFPVLKNLSLTGALLEFEEGDDPKLGEGDHFDLTLTYGEHTSHLRTQVGRRSVEMVRSRSDAPWQKKARYGVLFSEIRVGPTAPPHELAAMVADLRERWLTSGVTIVPGA